MGRQPSQAPSSTRPTITSSIISSYPSSILTLNTTTATPTITSTIMSSDPQKSPLPYYAEISRPSPPPPAAPVTLQAFLATPSPSSLAEEVRKYLVQVMLRRDLSPEHAQNVASRWIMGTGRELRSYTVPMYRDVFGPEGWVIYLDVKTRLYREGEQGEKPEKGAGIGAWMMALYWSLLLLALCLIAGGIVLLLMTGVYDSAIFAVPIVMLVVGSVGGILAIVKLSHSKLRRSRARLGPEERAERELREKWEWTPKMEGM